MDIQHNNVAGRLWALFSEAADKPKNWAIGIVWCDLLKVPRDEKEGDASKLSIDTRLAIYDRLNAVYREVRILEQQIRDGYDPTRASFMLKDIPRIKLAITPHLLGNQWVEVLKHLDRATVDSLENCAIQLPKEGEIGKDDLEEFKNSVTELMAELSRGKIKDESLSKWLFTLLSAANKAIDSYWIGGARHFREALDYTLGEILLVYRQFKDDLEKNEDAKGFWSRMTQKVLGPLGGFAQKYNVMRPLLTDTGRTVGSVLGYLEDLT